MREPTLFDLSNDVESDRNRLKTLAGELALRAGRSGVCVSDLRIAAENRGILTGQESGPRMKMLNLGDVMKQAGLSRTGQYRRSDIGRSHGNLHAIWILPEFASLNREPAA